MKYDDKTQEMNYELLLQKYICLVAEEEGVTFINRAMLAPRERGVSFTQEEITALEKAQEGDLL